MHALLPNHRGSLWVAISVLFLAGCPSRVAGTDADVVCSVDANTGCTCDGGATGVLACGPSGETSCACSADASVALDATADTAPAGELGDRCARNEDCASNICLMIGRCSRTCMARTDCPSSANWLCASIPGRGTICACTMETGREEIACNGVDDNCDSRVDETSRMCDGMCVDIARDTRNCGSCGVNCGGGQVCRAGTCGCPIERPAICDALCVDTQTHPTNCGSCGNVCPGATRGTPACVAGACTLTCPPGSGDCDSDPTNGCETDTRSSLTHCGSCGRACSFANATGTCSTGSCVIGACAAGFGNCDSDASNGCETATTTSIAHCGACAAACAPANAIGSCSAGSCGLAACMSGYANCDTVAANGCEINTQTDASNCGVCGRACRGASAPNTVANCESGACSFACAAGYADCDGSMTNGCEASLDSGTHCGMCGRGCPAGEFCVARTCSTRRVPVQLAAGDLHTCARFSDGTVRCWGDNTRGQIGDGTSIGTRLATVVTGLSNVVEITAGSEHTCARLADGTVRCWGGNQQGQLGNGDSGPAADRFSPVSVTGLTGVVGIAAGFEHTCARMMDGTVRCWGRNSEGALGDGTTTRSTVPVPTIGLANVSGLYSGASHNCAGMTDGTARCWGANYEGQLGDGSRMNTRPLPVAVVGLTSVGAMLAAYNHSCALVAGGAPQCWGYNTDGALGDGTTMQRVTPVPVSGLTTVAGIASRGEHTCAWLSDGTARCWGRNRHGEIGDGSVLMTRLTPVSVSGLTTVVEMVAGTFHTCARLTDATVRCWGDTQNGQVGDGSSGMDRPTPQLVLGL